MEQKSKIMNDFETLLKERSSIKPLALYAGSENDNCNINTSKTSKIYSARDVLTNVSKQVKAIQNADTASYKRVSDKLYKYKRREFLSVDKLPIPVEVPGNIPTKFDTQCVTNTQLIDVIDNAEIIDRHRGITQEFDETFCQISDNDECDDKLNEGSLKHEPTIDIRTDKRKGNVSKDREKVFTENSEKNDQDSKLFENSDLVTCEMDTISCYQSDVTSDFNDSVNIYISHENQINKCAVMLNGPQEDADRSVSPVLNTNKKNNTPPLVVSLYTFENFENLAHPIIEEHKDLEIAKNVINSQIIGREIFIQDHIERDSPVLDKIECITTNIIKEDLERVYKKYLHEDTNETMNENFTSENDRTQSNIIKAEIKDEILFSSDEEYEYLHKDVQELPLTCALETSFYERSDVLDKTMYVGFQTASNKSIQIHTDSFYKAKSILGSVDNVGTETTLNELVNIFDSGNAICEDVQSMKLEEVNTKNNIYSKIECSDCKDLEQTSIELVEKTGYTLDRHGVVNDDDDGVVSQVIEFKNISRSDNLHNCISEEKIDNTLYDKGLTTLEHNNEVEDDVPLSQIIEFKSIARTHKLVELASNTDVSETLKRPGSENTKQQLEGFKTSRNKKIKLSDKALARCKKVFQDILLDDNEGKSDAVREINNDLIMNDQNVVKANLDLSKFTKEGEKINYDLPRLSNAVSAELVKEIQFHILKSDLKNTEMQPKLEDMEFQINDQIILQEFTDNEMPFDEKNNNAFVGFKTASNKNIAITDTAMVKTKNLFKDIMSINEGDESKSIPKTIEKSIEDRCCNIFIKPKDSIIVNNKQTKGNEDIIPQGKKEEIYDIYKPSTSGFSGFRTAANKEIIISEQARQKTENFYTYLDKEFVTNIDSDEKSNTNIEKINKNRIEDEFNCGIDTQDFFAEEMTRIENLFQENIKENNTPSSSIFQDFQTASKKPVVISEKAMKKSMKLFEDITNTECDTRDKLDRQVNVDNINELNMIQNEKSVFKGFQTASNKKLNISDKAIEKCKKIFQDIFNPMQENVEKEEITDIKCPSEKIIHDVQAAETKPKDVLSKEIKEFFSGFQSACSKTVHISETALEFSGNVIHEIDLNANTNKETGFKIANAKKSEFESKDNEVNVVNSCKQTLDPKPSSIFIGFQTASNKEVKISAKALAKSKQMLNEFELNDDFVKVENTLTKPSDEVVDYYETIKNDIKESNDSNNKPSTSKFVGFQPATKEVKFSIEALAKSKNIFQDIGINEYNSDIRETLIQEPKANQFEGFQTASNKKVSISLKALEKGRTLFNDIDTMQNQKHQTKSVFKGFQTASNKDVNISNAALGKIKQIFQNEFYDKESNIDENFMKHKNNSSQFKVFQTATNKIVNISEKALEKSRKLFVDIDTNDPTDDDPETAPVFRGFQTANMKEVQISEKALAKSKKLFEDLNLTQLEKEPKKNVKSNTGAEKEIYNIQMPLINEKKFQDFQTAESERTKESGKESSVNPKYTGKNILEDKGKPETSKESKTNSKNVTTTDIMDTQVLNDFQDTLNTEDFCKSTPKSKRSGSPILSCPRAKKRKFETPYRSNKKIEPKGAFKPPKLAKTYDFNTGYKRIKKYTLKDIEILENKHTKIDVDSYISEFNFETLLNFQFFEARNDYTKGKITTEQLKMIFLDSVDRKIVPDGWLDNHVKLILWKLLSYEIKYPNVMKNICTVRNVLEQLKYRYDRELYHVQRPILRKILEKDEVPSKTMVLCVADIYVDNVRVTSKNPSPQNVELLLTDGWYCVKACTDRMLAALVSKGSIAVGTKIAVCGAELVNCEQGVAPWEDTSSVRLKLSGNSVRRARCYSRLGPRVGLIQCPLGAVRAEGGRVSVRALVTRVYPALYVERMADGSTVTLSERLENIRQMKYETEREAVMEKLYEEVEKEMSDQESQDSEGSNERTLDSGSQISKCMKKSKDPDEYRSHLTKSQNRMLEEHSSRQREKLIERVRQKFQQKLEKTGLKTERNVIPLLKVRIAGITEKNGVEVTKGYLSIWRPSAAVLELVTEGAWVEILNVIPTGTRNSEFQLTAGRQTVFNPYKQTNDKFKLYTNTLKRKCYEIKEITLNPAISTDYNEIDTVGIIFCVEPSTKEFDDKQNFQNVYFADADKNIICVNFWGGLKKFGFDNVLDTGQIVTCVNLQKRVGNTRKSIPQYRVTEFSYFTKTPKDKKALEITNELTSKLSKIKEKFCQDCLLLKNNYSVFKTKNNENISPYRFDCNVSRNTASPLRTCDANLNLTGLDFESSFDMDISPQALLRKKRINEKIEKIRLNYGEPPPLASIHIVNKSKNASATYKSPLISNLERSKNVASETPCLNVASVKTPVSMDRTFVKNINPVKLDFSSANNLNDSVDHFAEDFEASPPLSLDSDVVNN